MKTIYPEVSQGIVNRVITIINAATFPMYYNNMRSMIGDMVRKSELIIFNRCDGIKDLASYKRRLYITFL